MDEQLVTVKGKGRVSKEIWDAIWRNAPHVDLRKGPAVAKPLKSHTFPTGTSRSLGQIEGQ